jgi:two-component system sensor histidine kinase DesK
VNALAHGGLTLAARFWAWTALVSFVVLYLVLVFRQTGGALGRRLIWTILGVLFALATTLSLTLGSPWLALYVYVAVACGATLPLRTARWLIGGVAVVMVLVEAGGHGLGSVFSSSLGALLGALLGGFGMTGVRQMALTTMELRHARATVAQLAANEERLRLARDLHDLLGHSLSLITLKSELAGRMLPAEPVKAAQQVQDIEQVSRQALVDVREAVSGYRRPRLLGELAGAQVALTAAGIVPVVPAESDGGPHLPAGFSQQRESVLAWALREAVTNVVRHSGARNCTIDLTQRQTLDGAYLELAVEDDGTGGGGAPGNGLTGLTERLAAVGGVLEAASRRRGGFRLVARVPLGPLPTDEDPVGSGT